MTLSIRLGALLLAAICLCAMPADAVEIDAPVVDETGVLSASEEAELASRLRAHRGATGIQMAVLLVDTTGSEPIEDFSLRVAQGWEGGSASRDDGVLLTLAIDDQRSRLEVGHGLEPWLTDIRSKRILDSMQPMLRDERYADGLHHGLDQVFARTEHITTGGDIPSIGALDHLKGSATAGVLLWLFVGAFLVLMIVVADNRWPRLHPWPGHAGVVVALAACVYVGVTTWHAVGLGYVFSMIFGAVLLFCVIGGKRLPERLAGVILAAAIIGLLAVHGDTLLFQFGETTADAVKWLTGVSLLVFLAIWYVVVQVAAVAMGDSYYDSQVGSSFGSSGSGGYSGGGGSFGGGGASSSW